MNLVQRVLSRDRHAIARLITLVENDGRDARQALAELFPHTGRARVIGVTGPPGTGKSTLVNRLAQAYRRQGRTVGIVAVDPTSPFSGGAILGDRVRMQDLSGDDGVFIRSMATRGHLGGLAWATGDVVKVLDAAGFEMVFIETVGAGQSEVEVAKTAHTTVVVTAPGLGDDVQALKAGILEVADVLVVNKADRPGANGTVAVLESMLELDLRERDWQPPVLATVALKGDGLDALVGAIDRHGEHLQDSGELQARERARIAAELREMLQHELIGRLMAQVSEAELDGLIEQIAARELDPFTAIQQLLDDRPE